MKNLIPFEQLKTLLTINYDHRLGIDMNVTDKTICPWKSQFVKVMKIGDVTTIYQAINEVHECIEYYEDSWLKHNREYYLSLFLEFMNLPTIEEQIVKHKQSKIPKYVHALTYLIFIMYFDDQK